jgi:hypothetical protein
VRAGVTDTRTPVADSVRSRNRILILATVATIFSVLHHADHVIRGSHPGWPFQAEVTPFTLSLLIYALILPGIYLTARGCSIAGYHLFVAVSGLVLISFVHFVPVGGHETLIDDIYAAYGSPSVALFALIILAGLIANVALLATFALKALRTRA